MRHYHVYVDTEAALGAIEAVEALDLEDILDQITRREIDRLLDAEAAMVETSPVPAAWVAQRRTA